MGGGARGAAVAALTALACALTAAPALAQTSGSGKRTLIVSPGDKVQQIRFDSNRLPDQASFTIDVNPVSNKAAPKVFGNVRGDLVSEEGRRLPAQKVTLTVNPNGLNGFGITARVDPTAAKAGRYTGTLQFGGPGYSNVLPVTLTATLRDKASKAFLLMLLGWILGVIFKCLVDLFRTDGERIRSSASIGRWLKRAGIIYVALLGLLGGVIAWAGTYYPNHTWGAGDKDWLKVLAAAFTAVVTGTTLADVIPGGRFKST